MVKLNVRLFDTTVTISEDDFEMLLACLDNQKFVNEGPPCGDAIAMGFESFKNIQNEIQDCIDNHVNHCYHVINKGYKPEYNEGERLGTLDTIDIRSQYNKTEEPSLLIGLITFNYLLNCIINQKYIVNHPEEIGNRLIQSWIDAFNRECRTKLSLIIYNRSDPEGL